MLYNYFFPQKAWKSPLFQNDQDTVLYINTRKVSAGNSLSHSSCICFCAFISLHTSSRKQLEHSCFTLCKGIKQVYGPVSMSISTHVLSSISAVLTQGDTKVSVDIFSLCISKLTCILENLMLYMSVHRKNKVLPICLTVLKRSNEKFHTDMQKLMKM